MSSIRTFIAIVILTLCSTLEAQDLVASYSSNSQTGTIARYRITDGALLASITRSYQALGVTYLPTRAGVIDSATYAIAFGNRYLARVRASDGALLWVVDASAIVNGVGYPINDIAATADSVFVSTSDPGGRIARYRTSDGRQLWSVQRSVQTGYVINAPLRLAAVGSDWLYALIGATYLAKIAQLDGRVAWQVDISLKSGVTTYGIGDVTAGGGYAYVSNIDPNGTIRKINLSNGAIVWSVSRLYRVGLTNYQATKMALSGSDPVMLLFADRYLFRMSAANGQMTYVRDIGINRGFTIDLASDIAATAAP